MEFGSVVLDKFDACKETFLYLNIEELKNQLFDHPTKEAVQDYIMMMSLLGNDFVPHSISLTIKDGGYNILYNILKKFHNQNKLLVKNGKVNWQILKEFIGDIYELENGLIEQMCKNKKQSFAYKGKSEYDKKMANVYTLPAKWYVEKEIFDGKMIKGWEDIYYTKFLNKNKNTILNEYVKGLQWVLDYYNGKEIEFDWYYPYMYTPLWKDLYNFLEMNEINIVYDIQPAITPEQQLSIVLPPHSYNLINNEKYKKFLVKYAQYFPTNFNVHSLGKKWIYECESNIPILSSKILRKNI
jgi:5'-3' exonuclease